MNFEEFKNNVEIWAVGRGGLVPHGVTAGWELRQIQIKRG